jgi:hypothetical protein
MKQRALTAMITDAFFTWPSAVNIAVFLMLYVFVPNLFPWWQNWFWIVLGAVAEAIYIIATLTDPVARQQAVSRMLEERYDPRDIKNLSARQRLQKALEYKKNIDAFVERQTGALKASLASTASEIDDWIGMIYRMALSIDVYEGNTIIQRDRKSVPSELASLKRRLQLENDPGVKAEIAEAIAIREDLLQNLRTIDNNVKRTDIKMDNTIAQLSSIYAKLQLINSRELDSTRTQRLRQEIHDEILELNDIVDAMGEVYNYEGFSGAARHQQAAGAETPVTRRASGTLSNDLSEDSDSDEDFTDSSASQRRAQRNS